MEAWIRELVDATPFVDTHEHLIEEETRLAGAPDPRRLPCNDWALLFHNYLSRDLHSAGLAPGDRERFFSSDTPAGEKYRLVAAAWERTRNTGYGLALRHTLRLLYGEDDLDGQSVGRIAEKYHALVAPGLYRSVLRGAANVECCHVNSTQRIFMETSLPDLLRQDLSFVSLSSGGPELDAVEQDCGRRARSLEEWLAIIDWYFDTDGPRAVAVKNQSAYTRRLDYEDVPRERAAPIFARLARGDSLEPGDAKALQDFLFRYCVGKAVEQGLPVKLHTGYYAGNDYMPLHRLRRNASDLCPLLERFPEARFVLMHIGYPYQDEYIALAKHYRNVYVDMCWAWIINPAAGVRFLKEILLCAPATKVFTFGGDYITVENVVGHAVVARQGIAQALAELLAEGWLRKEEIAPIAERIMRGNAHEVFPNRRAPRPGASLDTREPAPAAGRGS